MSKLRSASLEDFEGVRGFTTIKARYLFDFLEQYPPSAFKDISAVTPERESNTVAKKRSISPMEQQFQSAASVPTSAPPLAVEAARTLSRAVALLVSDHAADFRNRLLREVGRLALQSENLASNGWRLSSKEQERALRRLSKIGEEFARALEQSTFDRKEQSRLADSTGEVADWLAAQADQIAKPVAKGS